MKHNNDITIPEDYQEGFVREQMKIKLSVPRKSFDRPAYYGTIAQVNSGHLDERSNRDIQYNS